MENSTVSVIMAVYNTPAAMLMEAVNSICCQTYKNIEFVIVNDHSTDKETIGVLDRIKKQHSYINLINNEMNLGLTKSLNIALTHCTGEYIARMDSDDISKPDRIMKQVQYMEAHKEVSVLGTLIEEFGAPPFTYKKYIDHTADHERFAIKMLFGNKGPVHPSVMIRRAFLSENGITYREEIKKAQDYALWVDCLNAGGIIENLGEPLLKYRIHEGQITQKNNGEQIRFAKQIVQEQIVRHFGKFSKEYYVAYSSLYSAMYETGIKTYIAALEQLVEINRNKRVFDQKNLEDEICQRWIHKCFMCFLSGKDLKGFLERYTWKCIFSKAFIHWLSERGRKLLICLNLKTNY